MTRIINNACNGNPKTISEFPITKALSFLSALWIRETPVMGIKRLLRH
jgi:hypothetical protein